MRRNCSGFSILARQLVSAVDVLPLCNRRTLWLATAYWQCAGMERSDYYRTPQDNGTIACTRSNRLLQYPFKNAAAVLLIRKKLPIPE